jgi:hypothetical protein
MDRIEKITWVAWTLTVVAAIVTMSCIRGDEPTAKHVRETSDHVAVLADDTRDVCAEVRAGQHEAVTAGARLFCLSAKDFRDALADLGQANDVRLKLHLDQ